MALLRARLAREYQPAFADTMLAAVRGVLRNVWQLGELDTDSYMRAVAIKPVRGTRLPAGRALKPGETRALFDVCSADGSPTGPRDAAAFALLFGAGLRRSEAVRVKLEGYDADSGALTITGKGDRQRVVYATGGGAEALKAWLAVRGYHDGTLPAPVNKGGTVRPNR